MTNGKLLYDNIHPISVITIQKSLAGRFKTIARRNDTISNNMSHG